MTCKVFNLTVFIPLDTVRREWMLKSEFSITTKLARHYDIFEHMFNGEEFTPTVRMSVTFGETDNVHNGNFLTPSQVSIINSINFNEKSFSHDMEDVTWQE